MAKLARGIAGALFYLLLFVAAPLYSHGRGPVVTDKCQGTRRDGRPCAADPTPGSRYCWHHDPDSAEERRRNASRAATLGNSKIDAEIRGVRLMVRDLVETTVSNELDDRVKKRLVPIAQLLQVYCRLAELELAAGDRPRFSEPGEYPSLLRRA